MMHHLAYALRTVNRRHLLMAALALAACSSPNGRLVGQTDFVSAPPASNDLRYAADGAGGGGSNGGGVQAPSAGGDTTRTVEETDLYRLDGDRLYYLNGYRGLMVFDVSDVDHPRLIGRSPIFGTPVEMIVRNGIAVVVVADWFGVLDDGQPFRGSIVRGLDARDPGNIQVLGEAKLGGWVRDTRVVGDVLYAVSEDFGWAYGWGTLAYAGDAVSSVSNPRSSLVVSSVSFANNRIQAVGNQRFDGYGGVFYVNANAILLAHDANAQPANDTPAATELLYLDISDPAGAIVRRGAITVGGRVQGWGADNGRWNLDFADGRYAHVIGCVGVGWGCSGNGYSVATADFANPNAPTLVSTLAVPDTGWGVTARFDSGRLYLSPNAYTNYQATPLRVYDLSVPAAPHLAGTVNIPGTVWNLLPAPSYRLFALGNDWGGINGYGQSVSLKYLDVSDASQPRFLDDATFGSGWAWTPAAGTFKAFTMDATKGLVVVPFSGWTASGYNNGVQLVEFTPESANAVGAAHTHGWVQRGIFVKSRLVSLSDTSLSVIDYGNHAAPQVVTELTLARNVIAAAPQGTSITEVSSDWWGNDVSTSEVRVLPLASAEESADIAGVLTLSVEGNNARVFRNGNFFYVVTQVQTPTACVGGGGSVCSVFAQQIQVVDLSNGTARLRGKLRLPATSGGWGWGGYYWWDWYSGDEVAQVGGDALAFRRWQPIWDNNSQYDAGESALLVVDLHDADAPALASVSITHESDAWWGNLRVVGDTLYTTHYEWFSHGGQGSVRYYVDRIDLSDRRNPRVGARVNVPGLLVGGSPSDPSLIYTVDYRWVGNHSVNDFDVLRLDGSRARLLATVNISGYTGNVFVRGDKAYLSAQTYDWDNPGGDTHVDLHAIDLADPHAPVDRVANGAAGWGWLLGVEGDRAVVTSGWGPNGVDIYQLADGQAPRFRQFVRTRGWWATDLARQDDALFLSSGYWGVQRIDLR